MQRPAGFWLRVIAFIVDGILLGIVNWLLRMVLDEGILYSLSNVVIAWIYFAGMESSDKQATFGKQLFQLKVTNLAGERISFGKATARYFSKILSSLILLIGYIMVAFTKRKQGLHDVIAGTLVWKVDTGLTAPKRTSHDRWERDDVGYDGDNSKD